MNSLKVLIYPSFCPPHPKHLGTSTEYYSLTQKVHYPAHLSHLLSMFIFFSAGLTNPPLLESDPCKITLSSGRSKMVGYATAVINLSWNALVLMLCVHCGSVGALLVIVIQEHSVGKTPLDSCFHDHHGKREKNPWWILCWLFKLPPRSNTSLLPIFLGPKLGI